MWFWRDLRLRDLPALIRAGENADVVPLFVLDPRLLRNGEPTSVVAELVREVRADEVHISMETTPFGSRRDDAVAASLSAAGARLIATGSPYAIGPGTLSTKAGPYRVFTPFSRSWRDHGWPAPAHGAQPTWFTGPRSDALPTPPATEVPVPECSESAALHRWAGFLEGGPRLMLASYGTARNRPDRPGASHMSTGLKYGTIHPRTMLFDIARHEAAHSAGAERYITELCWREFYADVLWHHPASAGSDYRPLPGMQYDDLTGDTAVLVEAWWAGRTRFPLVDAGMRQLLTEGWMHYRVRLVTASFLVKDLHVWWPAGARHFLAHLRDGDIASNNHGWQWCAGTGTDAAPYFRFFNPVAQGKRFDANGDYVRRYIPELRHVPGAAVHEPWAILDCCPHVYPEPIVDHAKQRRETLARYEQGGGR